MDTLLTADVAASSPRYRRRSSTFVDAIHDLPEHAELAPAQLYSTESGRLFHSGRIVIATVGLPARGKTHISVAVARYLRWLGVKTHVFHLGDYRRATMGKNKDVPDDYFFVNASPSSVLLRHKILKKCREDIYHFLENENGQIAIYDAVNPLAAGRKSLAKEFAKRGIQTIFIESQCTDERIIEENVRSVKISSPDYVGWSDEDAVKDYLARISARIPHFETMEEPELHWIKMINAGERVMVNNCAFGYLSQRIVFYLLNLHIKSRQTYFARAGTTTQNESYKADAPLCEAGTEYAKKMSETLLAHREWERKEVISRGGPDQPLKPLTVWTSTRKRSIETADYLQMLGYKVRQRSQLSQMNPGVCEQMTEEMIRKEYPVEVSKHEADPYHHRYPRAESYHDLAVRLEPIILELEREQNDLLIIAHESVLRVLYGYLMACNATDIPRLDFPRNEIIEVIPSSYNNVAKRIHIADVPEVIMPSSPVGLAAANSASIVGLAPVNTHKSSSSTPNLPDPAVEDSQRGDLGSDVFSETRSPSLKPLAVGSSSTADAEVTSSSASRDLSPMSKIPSPEHAELIDDSPDVLEIRKISEGHVVRDTLGLAKGDAPLVKVQSANGTEIDVVAPAVTAEPLPLRAGHVNPSS